VLLVVVELVVVEVVLQLFSVKAQDTPLEEVYLHVPEHSEITSEPGTSSSGVGSSVAP